MPIFGGQSLSPAAIWAYLYTAFGSLMDDDMVGIVTGGDPANPDRVIDNQVANPAIFALVNDELDITFPGPVYIVEYRYYGFAAHNEDGSYRLYAFIDGAWNPAISATVPTRLASWSPWTPLVTATVATQWRVQSIAQDSGDGTNHLGEMEFRGVSVG